MTFKLPNYYGVKPLKEEEQKGISHRRNYLYAAGISDDEDWVWRGYVVATNEYKAEMLLEDFMIKHGLADCSPSIADDYFMKPKKVDIKEGIYELEYIKRKYFGEVKNDKWI